jgi:2-deoxy-scyllo-inosamine dehydrogenase (SAM-dependent)
MKNKTLYDIYYKIPNNLRILTRKFYHDLERLIHYGNTDMFDWVGIETSTVCNRRCYYCPNSIFDRSLPKNEKRMNDKLFRKIINDLAKIKFCGFIVISGFNEPLMDERLPHFIRYTKKTIPKTEIMIITNGDFLTPKKYNELVSAGANRFFVSSYDLDVNRLRNIHGKAPIKYKVMTNITPKQNRGGLVEVEIKDTPACQMPEKTLVIDVNGNVILCCNDYHSSVIFGNLKHKSIMEIWNSKKYKETREQLKNRVFKLDICKKCNDLPKQRKCKK